MKQRSYLFHLLLLLVFVILQTTLFRRLNIAGVSPDIVFVLLIFLSVYQGSMKAQGTGFLTGILEDILSLAPPGFNAFILTLTGFLAGMFKGSIFFDPLLMPILFTGTGTIFKNLMAYILKAVFVESRRAPLFTRDFWIEVGINIAMAPIIFAVLKIFKIVRMNERESE